jgi:hypothetical protein
MGTIGQMRIMGGALVLSIGTSVFNSVTETRLNDVLGGHGAQKNHGSWLGSPMEGEVRDVLADGYRLETLVLVAFAGAQILALSLMWKKTPVRIL